MRNYKKRMAAHEGFTLVELIVVIAILAILAAVAYPVYTGYISRAHDAAALQELGSISTAIQGAAAGKGATVTKIGVPATNGKVTFDSIEVKTNKDDIDFSDIKDEVKALLNVGTDGISLGDDNSYSKGATWENSKWNPGYTAPAAVPGA